MRRDKRVPILLDQKLEDNMYAYLDCSIMAPDGTRPWLSGDAYALLRDMEEVCHFNEPTMVAIDLRQIRLLGQLADQLDYRLRGERLRQIR